jgi:hypothetical protein
MGEGEEGAEILGRGREAGEVEVKPAEERVRLGGGDGRDACIGEPLMDEGVDGMGCERAGLGGAWDRRAHDREEGPVLVGGGRFVGWSWESGGDPIAKEGDVGGLDGRPLVRHARDRRMGASDDLHERAGFGLAGDDGGPVVTALEEVGGGVEEEAGFLGGGSVAGDAMAGKEGLDVARVVRRGRSEACGGLKPNEDGSDAGHSPRLPSKGGDGEGLFGRGMPLGGGDGAAGRLLRGLARRR